MPAGAVLALQFFEPRHRGALAARDVSVCAQDLVLERVHPASPPRATAGGGAALRPVCSSGARRAQWNAGNFEMFTAGATNADIGTTANIYAHLDTSDLETALKALSEEPT